MYRYLVQQEDIDLLRQPIKTYFCRVELLNHQMQVVESLEGNVLSDSFSLDGESPIRRTYNCDLAITSSTFKVAKDAYIWYDRYIRVYYGFKGQRDKKLHEYLLGTFSFVDMNYSYSTTQNSLSLTCSDMMAAFNGTKGGIMTYESNAEVTYKALAGQTYREIIVDLLDAAGITKYDISGLEDENGEAYVIPYDQEWTTGATFYDAWNTLKELYGIWEFFFDEEGTFVWRKKPLSMGEDVVLNDDVVAPLVVSESVSDTFQNVYNTTEVWGYEFELKDEDRNTDECTGGTDAETDNIFDITLPLYPEETMDDIDNFTYIGITVSGAHGRYIRINGLEAVPIIEHMGAVDELAENTYVPGTKYVFCYRRTVNGEIEITDVEQVNTYHNFYLMGQYQAHGYYEETDPEVTYSVPNIGYKITKVVKNEKLYSDELCNAEAQQQTYYSTVKQDSVSLTMGIIPFLEPTQKIEYTLLSTGVKAEWVIKNLSWSSSDGVMTLNAYRFIEDYQDYYERRKNTGN